MPPSAHAKLSPSSASRWSVCEASVEFCKDFPDTTSPEAEEGTKAHAMAEAWLRSGQPALTDENAEMLGFVGVYVSHVLGAVEDILDDLLIEQRVPLVHSPSEYGTADAIVRHASGDISIYDLKYGRGVTVEAEQNKQLALYATGALLVLEALGYDIKPTSTVRLNIVQPRTREGAPHKRWELTVEELRTFVLPIREAAERIKQGVPRGFEPCEAACKFCPARKACPAFAEAALTALAPLEEVPVALVAGKALTLEQLGTLALHAGKVRMLLDEAEKVARDIIQGGGAVPGLKLVAGRSRRSWSDEARAVAALRLSGKTDLQFCDLKLKSPAAVEKMFGKGGVPAAVLAQVSVGECAPSLVPADDKRPALTFEARPHAERVAAFDDLDADTPGA